MTCEETKLDNFAVILQTRQHLSIKFISKVCSKSLKRYQTVHLPVNFVSTFVRINWGFLAKAITSMPWLSSLNFETISRYFAFYDPIYKMKIPFTK